MKITLGLIASLLMSLLSCETSSLQEITFKRAQPLGQKSAYAMKNNVKTRPSPESVAIDLMMDARIKTAVTAELSNGLSGSGKGKGSMTYDPDKARLISNKSDITMDMSAEIKTASQSQHTKSSTSTSIQIDLVDK